MSYLRVCICILAATTLVACSDSAKKGGTAGVGGFGGDGAGAGAAGVNAAGSGGVGGNGVGASGNGASGNGATDAGPDAQTDQADGAVDTNDAAVFEDAAMAEDSGPDPIPDAGPDPIPDAGPDPIPDAGPVLPWPPDPSTDLAGLPEAWATALCAALADCVLPTYYNLVYDGPACKQTVLAQLADGDFVYLQASIDAERVAFDKTKLAACYAALTAQSCNVFSSRSPAACDDALHGVVPNGEQCVLDNDCVPGSFCDRSVACPGTCAALRVENGACDRSEQCTSGRVCAGGKCRTPAITGEQCDENGKPPCTLGNLCVGADADMNKAGTCMDQDTAFSINNGQKCDPSIGHLCKEGSACVIDLPDGSTNTDDLDAFCRANVAASAACNRSFGPSQCPIDQYCPADTTMGFYQDTCEAAPGAGAACGLFNNCASGLSCKADNKCHAPARLDQTCSVNADCASNRCRSNTKKCAVPALCRLDAPAPACGDDTCDPDETCRNCADDCGACPVVCGDHVCDPSETCSACPGDCNVCPPVCGDGTCNGTDNCQNCPGDCGACPAPYSGPCTTDASCGFGKKCVKSTNPLIPAIKYSYCGETCSTSATCTGGSGASQRMCTGGACQLRCDTILGVLDPSWRCPALDMLCVNAVCTRAN